MKPVCVQCAKEMNPEKNGVYILTIVNNYPYQIWMGDMWRCSQCKQDIINGFGTNCIAEHFNEGFELMIIDIEDNPKELLIRCNV